MPATKDALSEGITAPYGHACANCSQSKIKCIIQRVGEPCERCRRTHKECRPAATVRRRGQRKAAISKSARLEEKLDSLVSLIKAGAKSGSGITLPSVPSTPDAFSPHHNMKITASIATQSQAGGSSISSNSVDLLCSVPVATPGTDTNSSYNPPPSEFLDTDDELNAAEVEENFLNFQACKSKYFPYVYIPPSTSAQQLHQERPFLWLCIMAVSAKSASQQHVLSIKVRERISQEMIFRSERNIDLLLGLLTFIGWAHFQTQTKPFLGLFNQLAMSLVFELRLNKPISKGRDVFPCIKEQPLKPHTPRTHEERRAVLGCFLISSIISSFLQKIDALRWTPVMDECLHILEDAKECPDDEVLVQQVRLQLIVEKKNSGVLQHGAIIPNNARAVSSLHESAEYQFQTIKTRLLAQPQANEVVLLHLYSAELEITLSPNFLHTEQDTYQQQKVVDASLRSIRSWLDIFFTIPSSTYTEFPFSIISQLFRCGIALCRLTTFDDSDRDETSTLKVEDSLLLLDRIINNLEGLSVSTGSDNIDSLQKDALVRSAQMFRSFRPGLEAKLGPIRLSPITNFNDTFTMDNLGVEFSDNDWLMDLLLSPSYVNNS